MPDPQLDTDTAPTPSPPPSAAGEELTFWERWGEMLVAIGVIALGVVVLVETQDIRTRPGVTVSPRIVPSAIGAMLVALGIWYAADIARAPHQPGGEDSEDVDATAETDWSAIGIIGVALLVYATVIERGGFIIASALLFLISTFAMGSRRYVRNAAIGLVLGAAVFFIFDRWLGVRLPEGWLIDRLD